MKIVIPGSVEIELPDGEHCINGKRLSNDCRFLIERKGYRTVFWCSFFQCTIPSSPRHCTFVDDEKKERIPENHEEFAFFSWLGFNVIKMTVPRLEVCLKSSKIVNE